MTPIEELLCKRELIEFIGVENHSTPYNPLLLSEIWSLPKNLPSKDLLILPMKGLGESYILPTEKVMCFGRSLYILLVDSPYLNHYSFLFESFPQTDDNNYFTTNCIEFLQQVNCSSVTICDIGIYKSRSLVNLLNNAILSLGSYSISVCLVTIIGYNSRGYTDIENEDEKSKYNKNYYLQTDIESKILSDSFCFIQIENKFSLSELFMICSQTKNKAETKLQEIKEQGVGYINTLKPLWDADFFRTFIPSFGKGDSFDFISLNNKLTQMGFKGDLIDKQWDSKYEKMCSNIRISNQSNRGFYVMELTKAIGHNIISTINLLKSI